jgi:hypothetical protein
VFVIELAESEGIESLDRKKSAYSKMGVEMITVRI